MIPFTTIFILNLCFVVSRMWQTITTIEVTLSARAVFEVTGDE